MNAVGLYAPQIRALVAMPDVAERYAGVRGRYIACPFHAERTPSLRLYADSYHCFGCGAHGDAVDFVAGVLDVSPLDAIKRINEDFALRLPIGRRSTLREIAATQRRMAEVRLKRTRIQREMEQADRAYYSALDEWLRLDRQYHDHRPVERDAPLHPLFREAARGLAVARYALEAAEERRDLLRWRYRRDMN